MKEIQDMRQIEKKLSDLQRKKDSVLAVSRDMIRLAGKGITLMHAKKLGTAKRILGRLGTLSAKLKALEPGFEYFSVQAHQEYVEASAFYTILKENRLASMKELHVAEVPYLLGIMDLVGELKRETIEAIRDGDLEAANSYYAFMKGIYDSTRAMRFANSLVPEFRRKQDTARIQLEGAAGEILEATSKKRYT
jgi:translin